MRYQKYEFCNHDMQLITGLFGGSLEDISLEKFEHDTNAQMLFNCDKNNSFELMGSVSMTNQTQTARFTTVSFRAKIEDRESKELIA
jgi:hypothetical protein